MDATPKDPPSTSGVPTAVQHASVGAFIASDAFDAAVLEAGRIGVARAVEAQRLHELGQRPAAK